MVYFIQRFNNFLEGGQKVITLKNKDLTVEINELGAEICSVTDQKTGYEFIWQADKTYWGRHAPVLFPIVGRLKNDEYTYEGKTYHMTQHGFARDSMFEVKETTDTTAAFSLRANDKTFQNYPFKFELVIKYVLEDKQLKVAYEVKNSSNSEEMYYGIGGHPAFNVSQTTDIDGKSEFDQISLRFVSNAQELFIPLSSDGLLRLDESEKQTVGEAELTHESFKNDALVYKIEADTEIILTDEASQVEIRLNPQSMEHVGIWSPYPARGGFVCLEPWAGVADHTNTSGKLEDKYAINRLNPDESMTHEYEIEFIKNS